MQLIPPTSFPSLLISRTRYLRTVAILDNNPQHSSPLTCAHSSDTDHLQVCYKKNTQQLFSIRDDRLYGSGAQLIVNYTQGMHSIVSNSFPVYEFLDLTRGSIKE